MRLSFLRKPIYRRILALRVLVHLLLDYFKTRPDKIIWIPNPKEIKKHEALRVY